MRWDCMAVHYVAGINEIPEGTHKIVDVKGFSIGIYNVRGEFHALNNYCPHQGAKLCKGPVCGTNMESEVYQYNYGRDQEIVRCPWHGWEFDIKTGKSLFSDKVRTKKFQVVIEGEKIGVVIGA
jgi:nitrite reductase (NADH) small subunit